MAGLKFIPGSTITQGFGPSRFNYKPFGITKNGGKYHDGQDEAAKTGTKIPAPESGVVTYQGYEPGGAGNFVIFKGDSGHELLIMHLSKFPGYGRKKKGQAIGYVGSTGNSTGPHAHITVYPRLRLPNGVKGAIDPQKYLAKLNRKDDKVWKKKYEALLKRTRGYPEGYVRAKVLLRLKRPATANEQKEISKMPFKKARAYVDKLKK